MTLEEYRVEKKLTLKQLAELLGITGNGAVRTAQRYTSHQRVPTRCMMIRIEKVTDGRVNYKDFPVTPVRPDIAAQAEAAA